MPNRSKSGLPAIYVYAAPSWPGGPAPKPTDLNVIDVTYLHFHSVMEIGVCVGGSGVCCTDEGEQAFQQGDVQIIFPFQNHLSKSLGPEPSRWCWVNLDPAAVLAAGSYTNIGDVEHWMRREMGLSGILDRESYPKLCELVGELVEDIFSPCATRLHRLERFACRFLTLLLELCEVSRDLPKLTFPNDRGLRSVAPALDAIKESLDRGELPRIAGLPSLCSMSPAGFRRAFKAAVGQSAKEYSVSCAMRRACRLLATTESKVIDISEAVGFDSISGFGRSFLRYTGLTPTEYKSLASGDRSRDRRRP